MACATVLGLGLIFIQPAFADPTVSAIHEAYHSEAEALGEFFKASLEPSNQSPERQEQLRQQIVEPASNRREEAVNASVEAAVRRMEAQNSAREAEQMKRLASMDLGKAKEDDGSDATQVKTPTTPSKPESGSAKSTAASAPAGAYGSAGARKPAQVQPTESPAESEASEISSDLSGDEGKREIVFPSRPAQASKPKQEPSLKAKPGASRK